MQACNQLRYPLPMAAEYCGLVPPYMLRSSTGSRPQARDKIRRYLGGLEVGWLAVRAAQEWPLSESSQSPWRL
jgi:hypothetical protein